MATPEIPVFDTSWPGVYQHRQFLADNAPTPVLREHFRRELQVMAPTLTALGIDMRQLPPPSQLSVTVPEGGVFTEVRDPPPIVGDWKPLPVQQKLVVTEPTGGTTLSRNIPSALEPLREWIEAASRKSGVPANLIAAMIWQESRGVISAVSINGGNGHTDVGLLQINPLTYEHSIRARHPELGSAHDPANNILAGAYYMDLLKQKFGSWDLALRAYNSGELGVDMNNPHATPAGTGDPTYVTKVLSFWATLDSGQGQLPP